MERRRGMRVLGTAVCTIALVALGACSSSKKRGSDNRTPLPVGPLTAVQFHAIGVGVQAPSVTNEAGAAQVLHQDTTAVRTYVAELCRNAGLIFLPGLTAYPSQVPAYEFMFAAASQPQQNCPGVTADSLDRERGNVATSMIRGQAFLDGLKGASSSRVNGFCDGLERTSEIDSAVISKAAEEVGVGETGTKLLEFGVELMVKNCVQLLDNITG